MVENKKVFVDFFVVNKSYSTWSAFLGPFASSVRSKLMAFYSLEDGKSLLMIKWASIRWEFTESVLLQLTGYLISFFLLY